MKKYTKTSVTILFVFLSLAIGIGIGNRMSAHHWPLFTEDKGINQSAGKLTYALNLIQRHYVDTINYDTLIDNTLGTLLYSLDPHSNYYTKENYDSESEVLEGRFEGIGALLYMQNDTVGIRMPLEQGTAKKAGLRPGDRILSVDGIPVSGNNTPIAETIHKIKGPRFSKVTLTVLHYGDTHPTQVTLSRTAINTPCIDRYCMLTDTIGYIKLNSFTITAYDEFRNALTQLKQQHMQHLILDLRDNGGGLLSIAVRIVDELLPQRELIVYTQGTHQAREDYRSTPGGLFCTGGITVLINEFSASASEIVAGAIQDNDRGQVVGRRSFGKGLVQCYFSLPDESALCLTTARYYTPSGRCIQRPYNNGNQAYMMEPFLQRYDTTPYKLYDTTPYYTRQGHLVYGGGGITPDHLLTTLRNDTMIYYIRLVNQGIFDNVAFDYAMRHWRTLTQRYKTADSFAAHFHVPASMMQQLLQTADSAHISRDPLCISKYQHLMRQRMKATLGMYVLGRPSYASIPEEDRELQATIDIIRKSNTSHNSNADTNIVCQLTQMRHPIPLNTNYLYHNL